MLRQPGPAPVRRHLGGVAGGRAVPEGRGWRRPFTASVLGLFAGELPCFDPDLALLSVMHLTRSSAPRVKRYRVVALPDSGQ